MARDDPDDPRDRARPRVAGALEQRLRGPQDGGDVARTPRVGEGEARRLGPPRDERLDISLRHVLAARPRGELVDLGCELVQVVADQLDQRAAALRVGGRAAQLELLRHPAGKAPLGHVPVQNLAGSRSDLRDRRVLLQFAGDERQGRRRRRRLQVRGDRLRVRGLPGLRLGDDDQAPVAREQPERVAHGDDVLPRRRARRVQLHGVGGEAGSEALERAIDLRPVAAGHQVNGLELLRHRRQA